MQMTRLLTIKWTLTQQKQYNWHCKYQNQQIGQVKQRKKIGIEK